MSNAINDTKQWVLDNPFIANEDVALKHLSRAVKKHVELVDTKTIGVEMGKSYTERYMELYRWREAVIMKANYGKSRNS